MAQESRSARQRMRPLWIAGAFVITVGAIGLVLLWIAAWLRERLSGSTLAWISALLVAGLGWFIVDLVATEVLAAAFHGLRALLPASVRRVLDRRVGGPLMLLGILSLFATLFVSMVVAYDP